MWVKACMCVHANVRGHHWAFSSMAFPYSLRQAIFLYPELTDLARLAGQRAGGVPPSLCTLQYCGVQMHTTVFGFYVFAGDVSSGLSSNHVTK